MKRILAVDDDTTILESIYTILTDEGYDMAVASNGTSAARNLREFHPDLILLDIRLPDISGAEIARAIKQNTATQNIPVVLISANFDCATISHRVGADDYLEKPFDIETLTQTVKRLIH